MVNLCDVANLIMMQHKQTTDVSGRRLRTRVGKGLAAPKFLPKLQKSSSREKEMRTADMKSQGEIQNCVASLHTKQLKHPRPAYVQTTLWDAIGRIDVIALIDTGSSYSILHSVHAGTIMYVNPQRVKLADGTIYEMDRATMHTIKIGDSYYEQRFYVVSEACVPMILGMDFLVRYGITISPQHRTITLADGEQVHMVSTALPRRLAALLQKRVWDDRDVESVVDRDYPRPTPGSAPMTAEQRSIVQKLLDEHAYCLASRERPLGSVTGLYHRVRPTGEPFKARLAALSPAQLEVQQNCIDEMLKYGVVQPSSSDWASRPSFAPKKDGTIRFCLNFRKLNQFDAKDNYPLPRAPDLLENLGKKNYFTSLDAAMGYWQIPIHPDDRKYTAVITQAGLFEFIRMPFGLSNAPATYQRMMDKILREGLRKFTCVYLDDVLIYSDTFNEHVIHVRKCMQWMAEAGLLLKAKKCSFFDDETEFLGHKVGKGQIRMTDTKIRKVIDFPRPSNVKEVQSFLGVTGYYRKFVRDYATIASPLNDLTKHAMKWNWTQETETAFQTLKKRFNENVPLAMPDYDKPFIIDTDASDIAVGAVLGQLDANDNERPVFFSSRKLSPAERKWPVRDKEALAILYGCQNFRHHILGRPFTVRSDHHSLQWLMDAQTGRIARWATMLAEYEPFEIKYRKGEQNKVADALSRVYAWSECMPDIAFALAAQATDAIGKPATTSPPNPLDFLTIPSDTMLKLAQANDTFCIKQKAKLLDEKIVNRPNAATYLIRDGLIGLDRNGKFAPVLPQIYINKFVEQVHCHPMTGHMGARRTAARASEMYVIPHLRKISRDRCNNCLPCTKRKSVAPKAGVLSSKPPQQAWEMISMDYCGPYPESSNGNKYVLVIIDQFTKYVLLTPCARADAQTTYRALYEKIICQHGFPNKLLSDNGKHFRNSMIAAVCATFKIFQTFSSPYYPQGDGQVERFMRNMNDSLSCLTNGKIDRWCEYVHGVQAAYNMTPHAATCIPPFTLLYAHAPPPLDRTQHVARTAYANKDAQEEADKLKAIINESQKVARANVEKAWLSRALTYNRGRTKVSVSVGQRCLIRLNPAQLNAQVAGKLRVRWSDPVMVLSVKESGKAFEVKDGDGRTFVVNATRMLPLPPTAWQPQCPDNEIVWDDSLYEPEFPGRQVCVETCVSSEVSDMKGPTPVTSQTRISTTGHKADSSATKGSTQPPVVTDVDDLSASNDSKDDTHSQQSNELTLPDPQSGHGHEIDERENEDIESINDFQAAEQQMNECASQLNARADGPTSRIPRTLENTISADDDSSGQPPLRVIELTTMHDTDSSASSDVTKP